MTMIGRCFICSADVLVCGHLEPELIEWEARRRTAGCRLLLAATHEADRIAGELVQRGAAAADDVRKAADVLERETNRLMAEMKRAGVLKPNPARKPVQSVRKPTAEDRKFGARMPWPANYGHVDPFERRRANA